MITHWIEAIMNYDIDYWNYMISPNYYIVWTLNFDRILN